MTDWPFPDPPDTAVLIQKSVLDGAGAIGFVERAADGGGWQFMANASGEISQDDAAVVGLVEVVALDDSVAALADLPPGWQAWRTARTVPWQRGPGQ